MHIPRFYYPHFLTAEEIVVRAGFTPAKPGAGWQRDATADGQYRLHCLTHHGIIDLHWDRPGGKQGHTVSRVEPRIAFAMDEFAAIDKFYATKRQRFVRLIKTPFLRGWRKW